MTRRLTNEQRRPCGPYRVTRRGSTLFVHCPLCGMSRIELAELLENTAITATVQTGHAP